MGYILYSGFGRLDRNLSSLEPLCFGMEVLFHLNQSPVVGEFILVVFRDKDKAVKEFEERGKKGSIGLENLSLYNL